MYKSLVHALSTALESHPEVAKSSCSKLHQQKFHYVFRPIHTIYIYTLYIYRERESIFIAAYLNQNYLKGMMIQIHNHAIPSKIKQPSYLGEWWPRLSSDHKMMAIGWGLIGWGLGYPLVI